MVQNGIKWTSQVPCKRRGIVLDSLVTLVSYILSISTLQPLSVSSRSFGCLCHPESGQPSGGVGGGPYTCRGPRPPEGLRAPSRIRRMQEGVGVLHGCAGSPQVHYRRGVGCCCSVSLSSHQAHCCYLWLLLACAGTRKIAFTSMGCVYK